jgi:peroxiredoxin
MTLELVNELVDIRGVVVKDRQPVERVQPLRSDELAPFFSLIDTPDSWQGTPFSSDLSERSLSLLELMAQGSVVVSFYCPCWGGYAQPFLTALAQVAADIQARGAQLVVFTNDSPRFLRTQADVSAMLLAYDAGNAVARQFGVYSETDPIWDRVSGISEDVYVPAIYVIDRFQRIRYHFLDENFEGFTQSEDLLRAIPQ